APSAVHTLSLHDALPILWGVYGASSVVVALAAGVFLLTLDRWGASYEPLGTPLAGALFVAACVAWALLTLQDGVLTGLRKAEWVDRKSTRLNSSHVKISY